MIFEINLIFLIKLFSYMTKTLRQTFKYHRVKQKIFFIIFRGFSVAKNCFRPDSAPLKDLIQSSVIMARYVNFENCYFKDWVNKRVCENMINCCCRFPCNPSWFINFCYHTTLDYNCFYHVR